jgi:ABC-2 type transport system ATP-binding protein
MEAIKAINLTKRYKDLTAVDRLNVTVEEGELFSLLGTNGAGKTTAIKMLTCLTAPTEGDAYINGHSIISDSTRIKKSIGVCPQETALAESLTVKENLELFCGLFGFDKTKTKKKIKELSELFHLGEILSKKSCKALGRLEAQSKYFRGSYQRAENNFP